MFFLDYPFYLANPVADVPIFQLCIQQLSTPSPPTLGMPQVRRNGERKNSGTHGSGHDLRYLAGVGHEGKIGGFLPVAWDI